MPPGTKVEQFLAPQALAKRQRSELNKIQRLTPNSLKAFRTLVFKSRAGSYD